MKDLAAGTIITNQFAGVEFSTTSEFGLMLFDTNNVTGEDSDLAAKDLGNVLIISEDGDRSDPDDNAAGGTISLKFDQLAAVNSIGLLDIDEPGSSIMFYNRDGKAIEVIEIEALEDNSFQEISFDVADVARADLNFSGSGALAGIDFSSQGDRAYSNIYVFGDSLSDTGNLFNVTSFAQESQALSGVLPVIPPSPPYFEGRFSNGPLWIEKLAEELNIDLTPATELSVVSPGSEISSPVTLIDGNLVVSPFFNGNTTNQSVNFAYGLAQTGANGSTEIGEFVPGMERQVEFFVTDHLQADKAADSEALYILWGGSNDYFSPNADPEETIDNIEAEIESLYDVGGRNFLVVNLPNLGIIPEANNPELPASPEELTALVNTHNSLLDSTVDELEDTLTGANLTILDINSLFGEVIENPEEFGFTNITEPFLDPITLTPTAGADPDEYLFFDTIHPTEAGHNLVFDSAKEALGIESDILL
jgi:phospholipase/lecithinase/hemolysin